jgi:uncharacterized membrane protein YecN with MAPEG domain
VAGVYLWSHGHYRFCAILRWGKFVNQAAIATVGIYAALNAFILLWLVLATSSLRNRYKVWIGDGGVEHIARIMRGHANAVENMPIMLILLLIAAFIGTPVYVLHLLGAAFTIGRAIHAWHFIVERGQQWQRFIGFTLSALALLVTALGVLTHAIWTLF